MTDTVTDSEDPSHIPTTRNPIQLDSKVFWPALLVLLLTTGFLLVFPETSLDYMQGLHKHLTHDLGGLLLCVVFGAILWLGWLGLSKYGRITLGPDGAQPAYNNLSWFGMIFCTGIGSNVLYFGTTEWAGYYLNPPPLAGTSAESLQAADWAGAYGFFHWGLTAWAIYALASVPIAYMLHIRGSDTLRISTACHHSLPTKFRPILSQAIDVLFIFGLAGGVGTSLGVGVPMLSAVASDVFGFERGMGLDTGILVALTALFSYSVSAGLDKGIKLLSDINVGLAFVLLTFIAAVGPTGFILNQASDSLGVMLQNFVQMSLHMDAGADNSFAANNTVFFWAWWLAWAPFMGLFIARISYGRTIRQMIFGCSLGGASACWISFSILGHSTMAMALDGHKGISDILTNAKQPGGTLDAPQMVVELLNALPFPSFILIVFFILSFIFVATSLDSAAFTLASTASKHLPADGQPPRWHRLVWAFVLAGTSLSLMYLGGLKLLQTASLLVGFPLLFVMFAMLRSLMIDLRKHESERRI